MSTNRLKANFIVGLIAYQLFAAVGSVIALVRGGDGATWLGPLVAAGAFLGVIFSLGRGSARTSANLPAMLTASGAGLCLTLWGAASGSGSTAAALLATGSVAGSFLYVFWYSRLGRRESELLEVGRELPEFSLENTEGERVAASDFRGSPAVYLFFRGNWCPLCMTQIKEVAARYREIAERGARVVLVSPQSHDKTRELARRFDVPFDFLVDPGGRAVRQLGIEHEGGLPAGMRMLGYAEDTVLPTLVVTDASGKIVFSDQTDNYRVRPGPETFLRALGSQPAA